MKKLTAFSLALALCAALSTPALAADVTDKSNPKTQDVTIQTSIAPSYTVEIPANVAVTFNNPDTKFGEIKLSAAQLDPGKAVNVALNASGTLKNKVDENKTIAYTIKSGDDEFTSADFTTAGSNTALTIHIDQDAWNKAAAGSYADTVTFTISYE